MPEFETSVVLPSAPFIIKEAFTFVFVVSVYKLISFVFVSLDEFIKICGIPLSYAFVFPLYVNVVSLEAEMCIRDRFNIMLIVIKCNLYFTMSCVVINRNC